MTLDAGRVATALAAAGWAQATLDVFDELPSTSVWLGELLRDAERRGQLASVALPVVCATNWQTQGIGRRGKTWQSAPGNITFSLLSEFALPPSKLLGLSLVTGIAVAETLAAVLPVQPMLKWPNDVLVDGAKLCGLLIELQANRSGSTRVITGIGINVHDDPVMHALGIGGVGLSALLGADALPDRSALLGQLAGQVLSAYAEFEQSGWQAFEARWRNVDYLAGRLVTLHGDDEPFVARALGVAGNGALRVEYDGAVREVFSGDVTVRPRD